MQLKIFRLMSGVIILISKHMNLVIIVYGVELQYGILTMIKLLGLVGQIRSLYHQLLEKHILILN